MDKKILGFHILAFNRLGLTQHLSNPKPKPVHDGHYITLEGLHYKTSDDKYYSVKA